MTHYDIVHAADPRFRGGTGSAIRTEIIAAHRWGFDAAFLPYHGMKERPSFGFAPRIQAAIEALDFPMLSHDDPATCDILFAHHPFVFEFMPLQPPKLRPKLVVAVLHHPLVDGDHRFQYDYERLINTLEASFHVPVQLAPVGPIIRHQLLALGVNPERIVAHDLFNVIDETDWPKRTKLPPKDHAVIGRHSRNDPLKWPDRTEDIEAAYPDSPDISIRVQGEAHFPDDMPRPSNLHMRPFSETGMAEFLAGLDFYVYFHSKRWVEAFGIAIAEAMASGLVVILPKHFEAVFGEGAVYCAPQDVKPLIERFLQEPDEYRRQSRAARQYVQKHFGLKVYGKRMQRLYDGAGLTFPTGIRYTPGDQTALEPVRAKMPKGPARTRVLMVATNGIGLGHVTRLMAIAKYLPEWIEPVFFTLSLGTEIVRKAGYPADYIPSFSKSGVTEASWNDVFALELMAMIDATGAQGIIFDSNHPFPGLMTVLVRRTDLSWIWVRRAMWQPHHKLGPEIQKHFDLLIEPWELAAEHDAGPTARLGGALQVGPVLLVEPGEGLDRNDAAKALDLDPSHTNVAIQLGSQQNTDFANVRAQIARTLAQSDVTAFEVANPLAPIDDEFGLPQRSIYPLAKYASAIDLLIATAGYNGFHETVFHGIPTLFIPNEAPVMDHQHLRAHVAKVAGLGEMVRSTDAARIDRVIAACLRPSFRNTVQENAKGLRYVSGGRQAAVAIAEQLACVRTNRPLALALARSG